MSFHEEFFDLLPVGAYRTRPDGGIEYANHALAEMLGYPTAKKLKEANSEHFYVDLSERERWKKEMAESPNGKLICFKTRWRQLHTGKSIRVKNSARAIRQNGTIVAYEGIVIDITHLPTPPEPLRVPDGVTKAELWTDAIKDKLPICISRKDRERRVVWANEAYCKTEKISLATLLKEKNTDALIYGAEFDELYRQSDLAVLETGNPHFAFERHRSGDGKIRQVEVIKIPVFDEEGNIRGLEAAFWNLAELEGERTRAERIERQLKAQYNVVFEHDLNGVITRVNKAAEELTGRKVADWVNRRFGDFVAPEHRDFVEARTREKLNASVPADAVTTYELDLLGVDGWRISVEVTSRLLMRGSEAVGEIGYIRDLTNRKEVEQNRLREVHHRVKNSLQTIYSLLGTESDRAASHQVKESLEACRARILTIAQLHQQLYKSPRVDRMDVGKFLRELVDQLVQTYRRPWQDVSARVTVGTDIHLGIDSLAPCALILHELVSNAMKHAFQRKPDGGTRHGILFVNFTKKPNGHSFVLRVEDTGSGMPSAFDIKKAKSMGMRLIYSLATNHLRGSIEHYASADSGTYFVMEFPAFEN